MNIVFMGTPDFAAVMLKSLYEAGHNIRLVVTQPDRQKGRGKKIAVSEVKEYAQSVSLPIFQPEKIKTPEAVAELKKYEADIFVIAAFGQILTKEILDMPRLGCINVHASLLPKYRGASPIQWSIMAGEKETGVTIMQMNEGLDTGDIISSVPVGITSEDTGDSLHDKLAAAGAELLLSTLADIENGSAKRIPQKDDESCYAPRLTKQMGELDFSKSAYELERLIRAFTPWPGTYTHLNGKILKVISAEVIPLKGTGAGVVESADKNGIVIACGEDALLVKKVQLEGKNRMEAGEFLRGYDILPGTVVG